MKNAQSQGVVRRIYEKDGDFLVSFPDHDGYFKVPDALREKIRAAEKDQMEIAFEYNRDMTILQIF